MLTIAVDKTFEQLTCLSLPMCKLIISLNLFIVVVLHSCALPADDDTKAAATVSFITNIGGSLRLELRESTDSATFAIQGITKLGLLQKLQPADLRKMMSVRVLRQENAIEMIPLLGTYSVTDTELRFSSRFPLNRSIDYRVEFDSYLVPGAHEKVEVVIAKLPKKQSPTTSVLGIYPSADVLPENLLKFYIHFSAPMSRGEAYKRIHLMHAGAEVESPFLELAEELWDAEQKRFTVFIHPGRIKKGLKPREDSGTPMTDGQEYTLLVDKDWMDAAQQVLGNTKEKKFRVLGPDSKQPDPNQWKITTPIAKTVQPLTVAFDESLDHAMLERVVSVRDASGKTVTGEISIAKNETQWVFQPTQPWEPGKHTVVFSTAIEDLVGNNLIRPFETLEQEQVGGNAAVSATEIFIAFDVL